MQEVIKVPEGRERCNQVGNSAEESGKVPTGLRRCFSVWNGAGEAGAVISGYNTVIEPGILPETLRHRYRR